jgi:molecular chaperone HscB
MSDDRRLPADPFQPASDFFALFGLPRRFDLEAEELERRYRELLGRIHPDRFVHAGERERRLALQGATYANEAFLTLRQPLARARYLLQLAGVDVGAESNTAMDPDFLVAQMEWREAVQEARQGGDHHELEHLHHRLQQDLAGRYAALGGLLQADDLEAAAAEVRRLMFLEKLLRDIDDALAQLEDGQTEN